MSVMFNTQPQQTQNTSQHTSNFVWPSGFTPPDPNMMSLFGENNPFETAASSGLPAMTDTRLINALESQTAFIEGDPGGQDLELFYYRLVCDD